MIPGLAAWTSRTAAVLLGLCMLAGPAFAQNVRDVIVDQNSVLERFSPPLSKPRSIGVSVITDDVVGVAPEDLDRVSFSLRRVVIDGAVTLDPYLFAPLYEGLVGRAITARQLSEILKGIERIYREHDYYARAFAPEQDLAGGVVRIVVYESYIREVSIEGDVHNIRNLEPRLQPYIDRMVEMRPVRISQLMRYALLMSDLAGLTIDAEFSQIPDEPGAGRLVLRLDFDPSSFGARVDNFASDDIGPLEVAGNARFNNVFGLFETTDLLVVTNPAAPEELAFGKISQLVPLGPSGFAIGYDYARIWSEPDSDDLIQAKTTQAHAFLNYALLRSQERNVITALTLAGQNTTIDVNGTRAVDQRKRWVTLGATYDDTFFGVSSLMDVAFSQGIDAFDASGEDNDFRFATIEGSLSRDLTETVAAKFRYSGQYAFTDLPTAVKYGLGGETYGQAFNSGAVAGETGYALAFEMSKNLDLGVPWLSRFAVFGYADYGAVWNPPERADYEYASLGSVGGGVRAGLGKHLNVATWVAVPYKDEPSLGAEGTKVRFTAGMHF